MVRGAPMHVPASMPIPSLDLLGYIAVLNAEYGGLELKPEDSAEPFLGSFSGIDLGTMRVFSTTTNKGHSIRQGRSRGIEGGRFVLTLLEAGNFELKNNIRINQCRANQIILLDSDGSFETCQDGAARTLSISMPKSLLRSQFHHVDRICGLSLPTEGGFAAILHQMMLAIENQSSSVDRRQASLLTSSLISIMQAAYLEAESGDGTHQGGGHQLSRIRKVIDEHYWDSALSPSSIAARLNLSRSYISAVAGQSGTTISNLLRRKRLEEAARLLNSPAHITGSITMIAMGTGFQSVSHFSRCFREHYGQSPIHYRNKSLSNNVLSSR